jgi:hypothetical protein
MVNRETSNVKRERVPEIRTSFLYLTLSPLNFLPPTSYFVFLLLYQPRQLYQLVNL